MIGVCLLTCGREDLTSRTVVSFREHNRGRKDLTLWHVDAGAPRTETLRNRTIALNGGFETIWAPTERVGQMASFRRFMTSAIGAGVDFMLWLENDWESVAPIPPRDFFNSWVAVDTFRLFGKNKMRGAGPRAPAGTKRIGTDDPISWGAAPYCRGWEMGRAHWAAGGSVTRPEALRPYLNAPRLKDVILGANNLLTLRPTANVLWHIGEETTEGFVG